ncbi:N-acetylmuramoyl-L-alanine amidase [Polyangium sp. 6x1]|uniref:N-acetylmuramoyl-L-alanine amidase family protein n=1 Tax=Polyangium sp. 6x1 TaxID=3042689 RepID=UPI002482C4E8|nr:N-acetylmuramoyl-L-alanine amidase [Polyangium sp. 6x1]MDI1451723.1 N-acetylmuramoyl-L-alanine amidase [Polyangium sp. 6x1]
MSKMTAQVAAIDKDCAAASKDPVSAKKECYKKKWVVVIDPGHGGTTNVSGSKSNNAIGVVSGVLEKTMTQRFADILKATIEARAKTLNVDVEALLTKSDENINLTAQARADVVTDAQADFFIIIHFNAYDRPPKSFFLDITPGIDGQLRNKPPDYKRKLYSSDKVTRGPLLVKRADMPKGNAYVTSEAFGASVRDNVCAALKKLDSTSSIKSHSDSWKKGKDVPLLKQALYGKLQFACCYLEGDFVNVESGDRTWNPVEYASNIGEIRGDTPSVDPKTVGASMGKTLGGANGAALGVPLGPGGVALGAAASAAAGDKTGAAVGQAVASVINAFKDPTLPSKDAMYNAASEAIADAIFAVIVRVAFEELAEDAKKLWTQLQDGWKKLSEPAKE